MKFCSFRGIWVGIICLVGVWVTVPASGAVFIKIGDIKGESQAVGHEEEIDVLSWSWGVARPVIDGESGSARTRGSTEILDLEINKVLEKSTPKLFEACVRGTVIPEAILVIEREGESGGAFKILEIKMTNVSITSDSLTGSSEAIENVTMSFEMVDMTYSIQNPDGSLGGNVEMSYMIEEGE